MRNKIQWTKICAIYGIKIPAICDKAPEICDKTPAICDKTPEYEIKKQNGNIKRAL